MKKVLGSLSYANVMSTLAVVLVIGGGTAFAAYELGKNSVKSRNIAPGAVRAPDIAKGAVKRLKIAGGAVDSARLADASVGAAKIAGGAVDEGKLADSVKSKINSVQGGGLIRIAADPASPPPPAHTLLTRGPFRIYAKCWTAGTSTYGYVYAATTQPGTIAVGTLGNFTGQSGYLNPDSTEAQQRIAAASIGAANLSAPMTGGVSMIHGSNSIQFGVSGAVKGANVTSDANNYGAGGQRCVFSPYSIVVG